MANRKDELQVLRVSSSVGSFSLLPPLIAPHPIPVLLSPGLVFLRKGGPFLFVGLWWVFQMLRGVGRPRYVLFICKVEPEKCPHPWLYLRVTCQGFCSVSSLSQECGEVFYAGFWVPWLLGLSEPLFSSL